MNEQTDELKVSESSQNNDSNVTIEFENLKIDEPKNIKIFEEYWSLRDIKSSMKKNKLAKLKLKINKRNYRIAYLSDLSDTTKEDLMIDGVIDRNRALDGDIVCAIIKKKNYWKVLDNFKNDVSLLVFF